MDVCIQYGGIARAFLGKNWMDTKQAKEPSKKARMKKSHISISLIFHNCNGHQCKLCWFRETQQQLQDSHSNANLLAHTQREDSVLFGPLRSVLYNGYAAREENRDINPSEQRANSQRTPIPLPQPSVHPYIRPSKTKETMARKCRKSYLAWCQTAQHMLLLPYCIHIPACCACSVQRVVLYPYISKLKLLWKYAISWCTNYSSLFRFCSLVHLIMPPMIVRILVVYQ